MSNQLWKAGGYVVDSGVAAEVLSGIVAIMSAFAIAGTPMVAHQSLRSWRLERLQQRSMDLGEEYLKVYLPVVDHLSSISRKVKRALCSSTEHRFRMQSDAISTLPPNAVFARALSIINSDANT